MWICKNCKEEHQDDFDTCWKCQETSDKKDEIPQLEIEDLSAREAEMLGVLDKEEEKKDEIKTASKGKRFLNNIIDTSLPLLLSLAILSGEASFRPDEIQALFIVIFILHYVLFEFITGRTIGKYITATKVIAADGGNPNLFYILIRTLCRLIPFEALTFLGPRTIGLHDIFSKTLVVDSSYINKNYDSKLVVKKRVEISLIFIACIFSIIVFFLDSFLIAIINSVVILLIILLYKYFKK